MKKILLIGFALTAFSAAFAQFNQGRMLVGGSVSFSSLTSKTSSGSTTVTNGTYTYLTFGPSFGYFVMDNFAVGAGIDWSSTKYSPSGGGSSSTSSSFAFAPFARYYFGPGFFGQGAFGFGSAKNESASSTTTGSVVLWSLGIGYAYFLNDHVAIEPMFGYQSTATKYDTTGSPKDTDAGLALNIGIRAYLGDRK